MKTINDHSPEDAFTAERWKKEKMHNWDSKMIMGIRGDCEEKSKDTSSFVSQVSIFLYLGMDLCEGTEQVVEC